MKNLRHYIKNIVNEELLREAKMPSMGQLDSGEGMTTLYRIAFRDQVKNIFKYGYDRAFTASQGGNMYGPAVYCTFRLEDSISNINKHSLYGDCIMAMRLIGGIKGFLIFNERVAKSVYGDRWKLEDQISDITGKTHQESLAIMDNVWKTASDHNPNRQFSFQQGITAPCAHAMWLNYREDLYKTMGVRGLIYRGGNDGLCCIPYDFKAVIPYSVSYDKGRHFQKELTPELYQFIKDHADVEFTFGGKYDEVFQSVNGFTLVQKGDKFNIIDNETERPISKYWFDDVITKVDPHTGNFGFIYDGIQFNGTINTPQESQEIGCVLDPENEPYCDFSDLPELVSAIRDGGFNNFGDFFYTPNDEDEGVVQEAIYRIVYDVLNEDRTVDDEGFVTIDNFDDVKRLIINPENNDDVWFVQIIKRRKDNMGQYFAHNACDYITYYLIHDADELEAKRDEIISVCKATNSRAYIHPNKRSRVKLTDYATNILAPRFRRHQSKHYMGHEMEIAAGQSKDWPERKLCFLDIDSDDVNIYRRVMQMLDDAGITPLWEYRSVNNGWHILLPDKEEARKLDFSTIDNGYNFGRFSTVGMEIDKAILLYACLRPNGYGVQQNVQQMKMHHNNGRRGHHHRRRP